MAALLEGSPSAEPRLLGWTVTLGGRCSECGGPREDDDDDDAPMLARDELRACRVECAAAIDAR